MKKIVTIIGARPQFIKMALVSRALKSQHIKEVVIHTGQHYDRNMSDVFFSELNIRRPDYELGAGCGSHAKQTAKMLIGVEDVLLKEKPDMVLVYGDTNSTLAGALAASKLNIGIAHVEAGLRSFNSSMPEEINRVVTDSISGVLFCPTRVAVDNLRREGRTRGVHLVGDVMYDSLKKFSSLIKKKGESEKYILCTIHRAENTDNLKNIKNIFKALGMLKKCVILPIHPRTSKCIKRYNIRIAGNIKVTKAVSYSKMLDLEKNAEVIVTDSGGVQKEAFIFNTPCVTIRNETEWLETVKAGLNCVTGVNVKKIVMAVKKMSKLRKIMDPERFYGDGLAHERIAKILANKMKG
ncbi:MAG: UDP-N-acetylglucosamine 2-epimerase (non-hydrolyzing) [Candidatus Omnitrophota bacterium]